MQIEYVSEEDVSLSLNMTNDGHSESAPRIYECLF